MARKQPIIFRSGSLYYKVINRTKHYVEVTHESTDCANYEGIVELTIPASVTHEGTTYTVLHIGRDAFAFSSIVSIVMPDTITRLEETAFWNCDMLTSITFSKRLRHIGHFTFGSCQSLSVLNFPDSLRYIESNAFDDCRSLEHLVIPAGVKTIEYEAFSDCSQLKSIVVSPDNKTYDSRDNCNALIETATNTLLLASQTTTIPPTVTVIGYQAFRYQNHWQRLTLPHGVTKIEYEAFCGCSLLTQITLPQTLTTIETSAFYACHRLTEVHIPASLTTIERFAFQYCGGLTSIHVDKGNPVYDSRNDCNAIIETITNTLILGSANTIIPQGVTLANAAFEGCDGLRSVVIPSGIQNIPHSAFADCDSLESVTLPDSVTEIGYRAFANCSRLNITPLLQHVVHIDDSAFIGCNLTSLTLPSGVHSLGQSPFDSNQLTKISVAEDNPVYDSRNRCNAIIETATNTLVLGCCNTIIPDTVTAIGESAFSCCHRRKKITIPDNVREIQQYAFSHCEHLTELHLPAQLTKMDHGAVYWCHSLKHVYIAALIPPLLGRGAFEFTAPHAVLHVPASSLATYRRSPWSNYFDSILPIATSKQ